MQAQPKTIREILHTGDQYIIPLFQRYYSWEKSHWERLRMDVWALMENGGKAAHFLGPLVCTLLPRLPGSTSAFQLIDGQQRITTLTILLAAIRDVALARNLKDFAEEVTEDYLLFKRKDGCDRYKVLPRLGDREVLTEMIEGRDISSFADSRVFQAWKYFQRHVHHLSRRDTEAQLTKLLGVITARLNLVAILIDGENPYEIFESLNSTGLPLQESDLIRNFVFMEIPLGEQQKFHDQHWKQFEEMFDASETDKAVEMTPFYRDYLMCEGRYSKEDATFVDFKNAHETAVQNPDVLIGKLKRYARLDLMLRRPASVKNASLRAVLRQVGGMDISTAYPLLLNLLERHDAGELSKEDLCGCMQDLVSFVLRRSICGETGRSYNKWFVEAITVIRDEPRRDLQTYWLGRRWPDDAAVLVRLPHFELYRRESIKTRVILESVEESFGHRERVNLSSLTIEHVMPQTIVNNKQGKAWQEMLGADWGKSHETLLHTLGNLTLTGYNTELSNSAFETKKVELANSHIDLNNYFEALQKWDAEAILARTDVLAKRLLTLWPRPVTNVAYAASTEAMPEPEGLSTAAKRRLEYWRHLDTWLEDRGIDPALISPVADSSLPIPLGTTGEAELVLGIKQQRNQIHVSLMLSGKVGERIAQGLDGDKDAIHQELGYNLFWELTNYGGEIYTADEDISIRDQNDWPVQHDWFGDRLEDFQRVLIPRVLKWEELALQDPELRQSFETRELFLTYWKACSDLRESSPVIFGSRGLEKGRDYCRFEPMDKGINLGAHCKVKDGTLVVYMGVTASAAPNQRSRYKDLLATETSTVEAQLGMKVDWGSPYFGISTPADINDRSDWPRQHQWVRETAEKVVAVFKPLLGIE